MALNLQDIKEQVIDQVTTQWNRFQESTFYIQAREKYDNLNSNQQKLALAGGVVLTLLLIFSIPMGYISSSSSSIDQFLNLRQLTRDLLRVTRTQETAPVERISASTLRGRVEDELKGFRLQKEQIGKIEEIPTAQMAQYKVGPTQLREEGVQVVLSQLNAKQIVDISHRLSILAETVKLAGMQIQANAKNNHYFDVTFQLSSFFYNAKDEPKTAKKVKPKDEEGE